jgi:hypothetical protein
MSKPRCSPDTPAAILSFHSHSDRSFLDDRELALLSGTLRQDGIANDLILVVIPPEGEGQGRVVEVEQQLVDVLASYDPIVYERVWSARLVEDLRRRLPDKVFIGLRGEHVLLDSAPADVFCDGEPKRQGTRPPAETLFRHEQDGARSWRKPDDGVAAPPRSFGYAPNLRPVIVNADLLPEVRTFSIQGNDGCPFQLDARDNPLYAGVQIPQQYGRGCAFCTTGNHYEGRPNTDTAAAVLEQLRYVRANAPEIRLLVLKDQNPFGYLTEVIERCESEGLGGFSLLLETRAEWLLRNAPRFDRALAVARRIGVQIAPFLVGIENFSQPELDRFNKGTTVAANIEFLETLWRWKEDHGEALDLSHAAFGFILFTPWTTLADLEANLAAIRRTRFDALRGSILLSRVRLYPDTALYYLAERDGLLVDEFDSTAADASRRYGYYPSRPWKHQHDDVAHFAALATQVADRNHSRDMVSLFDTLLAEFRAAGAGWATITADDVWQRYQRQSAGAGKRDDAPPMAPAGPGMRSRLARLVQPLSFDATFAGGWRFAEISAQPGRVEVGLQHDEEPSLVVELVPRGRGPHFQRSRH